MRITNGASASFPNMQVIVAMLVCYLIAKPRILTSVLTSRRFLPFGRGRWGKGKREERGGACSFLSLSDETSVQEGGNRTTTEQSQLFGSSCFPGRRLFVTGTLRGASHEGCAGLGETEEARESSFSTRREELERLKSKKK